MLNTQKTPPAQRATLSGSSTSPEGQTSDVRFESNDSKVSQPFSILDKEPKSLTTRILALFLSKNSFHLNDFKLHYNGIRHELNYPDHNKLTKALKYLVKSKQLVRRVQTQSYRTSIFILQNFGSFQEHQVTQLHSQIEKSIALLNKAKGRISELLIKRVLKKISSNVKHEFQFWDNKYIISDEKQDRRIHIDVYSDDYIVESKNWDRSQKVGKLQVKKYLQIKNKYSKTNLNQNMKFFFIATTLTDSAKKMLKANNILYIEVGYQVLSWSSRSAYIQLFRQINEFCPKTYNEIPFSRFEMRLQTFIQNGLNRSFSTNSSSWSLIYYCIPHWWRKEFIKDRGS